MREAPNQPVAPSGNSPASIGDGVEAGGPALYPTVTFLMNPPGFAFWGRYPTGNVTLPRWPSNGSREGKECWLTAMIGHHLAMAFAALGRNVMNSPFITSSMHHRIMLMPPQTPALAPPSPSPLSDTLCCMVAFCTPDDSMHFKLPGRTGGASMTASQSVQERTRPSPIHTYRNGS